jgi:hypothetical protein
MNAELVKVRKELVVINSNSFEETEDNHENSEAE